MSSRYRPDELPGLVELEVDDVEALNAARRLTAMGSPRGARAGLRSGAVVGAPGGLVAGDAVITVFPDRMERYFSTSLFAGASPDGPGSPPDVEWAGR